MDVLAASGQTYKGGGDLREWIPEMQRSDFLVGARIDWYLELAPGTFQTTKRMKKTG